MEIFAYGILIRCDGAILTKRQTSGTSIPEWARRQMNGKPYKKVKEYPAAGGVLLALDPEEHKGYRRNPVAERMAEGRREIVGDAIYLPGRDEHGSLRLYSQSGAERERKILEIAAR